MTREAMKRTLGMRHFDVQLMGAAVLHQGRISEMKTGEGKTLVAPMAAILNALTGRGVHIVTPNDYLARRDPSGWVPSYHFLGVSLGMVTHDESFVFEPGFPTSDERLINLRPVSRREAYAADVTYGDEQRVRLRLSPRQHGHRAGSSGSRGSAALRSLTRSTTSSSTRLGRRSSSAARRRSRAISTTSLPDWSPSSADAPRARRRAATSSST